MKTYPFEEFLKDIHAEQYTGLDDDMPDNYENWITNLDGEELIGYGNKFGNMILQTIDFDNHDDVEREPNNE